MSVNVCRRYCYLSVLSKILKPERWSLSKCRYSAGAKENDKGQKSEGEKYVEELLEDAASGGAPFDEVDEDDNWSSTPYPVGAVTKQSQALKSLRPRVDPRETSIVLFPGQGSQFVGMGKKLLKFPGAKDIFYAANEILKYDLLKIMLEGPKAKLDQTIYCQPAIYVCSIAAIEKLKEERPTSLEHCMATAGFSVGELAALTFAGVFTFEAGLNLVKVRAEAMQLASEAIPGGMAVIEYGPESKYRQACLKAKEWCVERGIENPECRVANYIGPKTKVIAGNIEALKYLASNKSVYKLTNFKMLPEMKGAFHSNLMVPAVKIFRDALKKVQVRDPILTVHSNIDGKMYTSASHIRQQLPAQMFKPVRWEQTLHILYERTHGSPQPYTFISGPGDDLKKYLEEVNLTAAKSCFTFDM